jgi:hypothetical protein
MGLRMDAPVDTLGPEALADLELLVFGGTKEDDDSLLRRFLAADPAFNAHLVARLAREPVVLH